MTVNGASSSNLSSLYNSSNIISGLASGLDTEGMIESLVQSYTQKIASIQQKVTKTEWQQEAYRSIIDKMVNFTEKYASFTSSTNLLSSSFFTNATKVNPQGSYSDCVTASGKSSSEILLNEVTQLASGASWSTSLKGNNAGSQNSSVTASTALDFSNKLGTLDGTLSLTFGDQTIQLSFDDVTDSSLTSGELLAQAITQKLDGQNLTLGATEYKASDVIEANFDENTGEISLAVKASFQDQGEVRISGVSGTLAAELGLEGDLGEKTSFKLDKTDFTTSVAEHISGASMTINLNGTSRTFNLPDAAVNTDYDSYKTALNDILAKEFGARKLTASFDGDGKLTLTGSSENDQISIQSSVNDVLGFKDSTTSYIDTNKTLEQLGISFEGSEKLVINGKPINDKSYTKDTKLSDILNDINNSDAGLNVSYSKLTNSFLFTTEETGADQRINISEGEGNLAARIFGSTNGDVTGKDAKLTVTVNDKTMELTRSSNSVDLDGLTVNLKKTFSTPSTTDASGNKVFNKADAVSFDVSTDADSIVEVIKSMVDDYNAMMTEIKKTYSTAPLKKTDGSRYEPLTEEDAQDMSESAIERYEEKAKQGLLFCDSDLTALYDSLSSIFSPGGKDSALLEKMGITLSYSSTDKSMSVTVDETKLRTMLDSDPDAVADVFTRTSSNGSEGIMTKLKNRMDVYSRTIGSVKGILVQKAGTTHSPLSMLNNTFQTKIDDYNTEIEKWQKKLSTKIDYYTKQFTRLETLINQMNSQSSALSGLMGGY